MAGDQSAWQVGLMHRDHVGNGKATTFENRKRCPQVRNAQESASLPDDMVDSRRR
jgi:hypothetical protein